MSDTPPVILSIAGFDPSSGAGVTADIKTIAAHGCYGLACITAMTVQSTAGVRRVEPLAGVLARDTLEELSADMEIAAVRLGMLGSGEVAQAVADFLRRRGPGIVVLDPVFRSSSGAVLLDETGLSILKKCLIPMATVITPNLDEAAALTGLPVTNLQQMKAAGSCLHQLGAKAVVLTGGHMEGEQTVDLLSVARPVNPYQEEFPGERLASRSTHGTGCAFATALTCNLALGQALPEAVLSAKKYVASAIARAYPLGRGTGPVNHLFRLES
jgi:hydroxymethylpyrimidine/phosphomethylpyrimidine kinase